MNCTATTHIYSHFHIAPESGLSEFLCIYSNEKSLTFTEFLTNLFITKNIKIIL